MVRASQGSLGSIRLSVSASHEGKAIGVEPWTWVSIDSLCIAVGRSGCLSCLGVKGSIWWKGEHIPGLEASLTLPSPKSVSRMISK